MSLFTAYFFSMQINAGTAKHNTPPLSKAGCCVQYAAAPPADVLLILFQQRDHAKLLQEAQPIPESPFFHALATLDTDHAASGKYRVLAGGWSPGGW